MKEKRRLLARRLLAWFEKNRRDLPWRKTKDPYAIWLSEVMLQQTRVKTALEYFPRFLRTYPTVDRLAKADLADVLGSWSGLGYYRRARALHAGAREVVERYGGELPRDAAKLREISGIGPYTAGAIASIAFGAREPLVDGNVARVLARIFGLSCDVRSPAGVREVWALARDIVPEDHPGGFNESLMELGATVCVPGEPRCAVCPVAALCDANATGRAAELPVAAKKKPPREVDLVALVSRRGDRVLLGRRKEAGLFGGLWEPPMIERRTRDGIEALLGALLGEAPARWSIVGEQTHVLTHRKFRIAIATAELPEKARIRGDAYDRTEWHRSAALGSLGMSSLAKKILLACPVSP